MEIDYYTKKNIGSKTLRDAAKENDQILLDMIRFLRSDRKGYSDEKLESMTTDEIIDDVNEHLRAGIESIMPNAFTVAKDFSFQKDDLLPEEDKVAFSRLTEAFKNSDSESTGYKKALDYAESAVTDPLNVLSLGFGVLSGGLGAIPIQAAKTGLTRTAMRKLVKDKILSSSLKIGTAEAGLGASAAYLEETAREEQQKSLDKDYEKSLKNVLIRGAAQGVGSGLLNYGFGVIPKVGKLAETDKLFTAATKAIADREAKLKPFNELAEITLKKNSTGSFDQQSAYKAINSKLVELGQRKASLDPKRVKKGMEIKEEQLSDILLKPSVDNSELLAGFDVATLKRIAAAGLELADTLDIKAVPTPFPKISVTSDQPVESLTLRITDTLADAIENSKSNNITKVGAIDTLKEISEKYGLTNHELSALFAAEFSEAAKKLNLASQIAKSKRKQELDNLFESLKNLNNYGVGYELSKQELRDYKDQLTKGITYNKVYNFFRSLEDSRVGLMTTQIATTMRNTAFGSIFVMMDAGEYTAANTFRLLSKSFDKNQKLKLSDFNIFNGSFDVVKSLLFKRSEAEAVVALLDPVFPKELANLFNKRGIIESEVAKPNILVSAATKLNFLNTFSDMQFKRAVLLGNLNRRLQGAENANIVGSNISEVLKRGTASLVDERVFQKAVEEAYEKSFQTQFGLKGESGLSKTTKKAIDGLKASIIGTMIFPFPRFVASQAKFIKDYTPFSFLLKDLFEGTEKIQKGGVDVLTKEGKPIYKAVSRDTEIETWAKQTTGVIALAGGYFLAREKAPQGYDWNQAPVLDGEGKGEDNIQALLGPLSLHAYMGDYIYRLFAGMPIKPIREMMSDVSKIFVGTDLRVETPLEGVISTALEGDATGFAKALSDLTASYTYPVAVVKDLYGQIDPRSSYLPETTDATSLIFDFLGQDIDASVLQRMVRFVPDFPSKKVPIGPIAEPLSFQLLNDEENVDNIYDPLRYDPFSKVPLKSKDPFINKQIFGKERRPEKGLLLKELSRLQVNPRTLYKSYLIKNKFIDVLVRQSLANSVPYEMEEIITNQVPAKYKNGVALYYRETDDKFGFTTDAARTEFIKIRIAERKAEAIKAITKEYNEAADNFNAGRRFDSPDDIDAMLSYLRGKFNQKYTKKTDGLVFEYLSLNPNESDPTDLMTKNKITTPKLYNLRDMLNDFKIQTKNTKDPTDEIQQIIYVLNLIEDSNSFMLGLKKPN